MTDRPPYLLPVSGNILDLGNRPHLMGILNVTPDSFSDGGRYTTVEAALRQAEKMAEEGADIIDVGGESTRPAGPYGEGAQEVSVKEELRRTIPVVTALRSLRIPISIDTTKAEVARQAVEAGASIVNDVSALRADPEMPKAVAESNAAVVLMHMKDTPKTMQEAPRYENIIREITDFLAERVLAAGEAGITRDRIIVDPGLGFGKGADHSYEIVSRLSEFHGLRAPLLVGASRKSFTGHALKLPPEERLAGSLGVLALCVERGAHIFRVHDVGAARQVLEAVESTREASVSRTPTTDVNPS